MSDTPNDKDLQAGIHLYALNDGGTLFAEVKDTTVAYAPIDDAEDALAARDLSNLDAGALCLPGATLRKLGMAI